MMRSLTKAIVPQTLLAVLFILAILRPGGLLAQSITSNATGTICVNQEVTYHFTGTCDLGQNPQWSHENATVVSTSGSDITLKWASPQTSIRVSAYCQSGGGSADTPFFNVYGTLGQVSVPSGTLTRCKGSGTNGYSASATNALSYGWSLSPGSAGSINSSGVVTWSSTFSGTATVGVAAFGCNSTTNSNSVQVNVTDPALPDFSITYPPICSTNATGITFQVSNLTNATSPTYKWYRGSPGGEVLGTGSSYTTPAVPEYAVQNNEQISCEVTSNGTCVVAELKSINASVTTAATPTVAIAPSATSICNGQSVTFSASSSYSITSHQWSLGGTQQSTNSTFEVANFQSQSSYDVSLSVTVNTSGQCVTGSSAQNSYPAINITVNPVPVASSAGQTLCSGQQTSISVTSNLSGTSLTWSVTPVNVSGASAGSAAAPTTIAQTLTNSTASNGTVTYQITPTKGTCSGTTISPVVTVKPVPTTANAGADQTGSSTCGQITLGGNAPTVGTGAWTIISGTGGAVADPSSPTSTFTGNPGSSYSLRWTISNSPCASSTDDVVITVNQNPTTASAGPDQPAAPACQPATLAGNTPTLGTGTWSVISGSGGTITTPSSPSSTFIGASSTSYVLRWTTSLSPCPNSTDEVTITFGAGGSIGGTVSPASNHGYGSASGTVTLSGQTGVVQQWETNIGGGWNSAGIAQNAYSFSNVTFNNTQIRAVVVNGTCPAEYSSTASITVHAVPSINYSPSQTIPNPGSTQISTTTGLYSYQWYKNGLIMNGETANTLNVDKPAQYSVRVKATSTAPEYEKLAPVFSPISAQTNVNYHLVTQFRVPGQTELVEVYNLPPITGYLQTVDYQDGLGRSIQQVAAAQSPLQKDIVVATEYDAVGRAPVRFLPYIASTSNGTLKGNAVTSGVGYTGSDQYSYYQGGASKVATSTDPRAVAVYEASPLNRVLVQGAPGYDWQPAQNHAIKNDFLLNDASQVRDWEADGTTTGYYAANLLLVIQVTDENGNKVRTFSDKLGRTLLKQVQMDETLDGVSTPWLETYYIYDVAGRLKYQVPPKALKVLGAGSSIDANHASVAELIFKYTYDARGRLIEKKTPGAAVEYVVYDLLDRPMFTQDGSQRTLNVWGFQKFDRLNRVVYAGIYNRNVSRSTLQSEMDARNYDTEAYFEGESTSATYHGYTNNVYPTTDLAPLKVIYYDHYDFDRNGTADYTFDNSQLTGMEPSASLLTRNLATGSRQFVVNDAGDITTNALINATFYDSYGRVIQVKGNNHLSPAVDNSSTAVYDFGGRLVKDRTIHKSPSTKVDVAHEYVYDHAGRLSKTYQFLNHDSDPITWQNLTNATATGNDVTSTQGSCEWGIAGASSVNVIPAGTDGWIETTAPTPAANQSRMFGLSDSDVNTHYNTIDYAIYLFGATWLYVYENGTGTGQLDTYLPGDILRVERSGTTVRYKKNGITFYTSPTPSSSQLIADVAFNNNGDAIRNARIGKRQLVSELQYNELGQVVDKKLHNTSASDFLQSVDFRYSIRGWLESINNSRLDVNSANNDESNDYYGMEFIRHTVESGLSNTQYYNGNISAIKWKGPGVSGTADQRSYNYTYDKSDRLKTSTFQAYAGAAWNKESNTLNESMTYDHNGNIMTLERKRNQRGLSGLAVTSTAQTMDNLAYTYTANQLSQVEDSGISDGFANGITNSSEFTYDQSGNVSADKNKGIDAVLYNALGKVRTVQFTDGRVVGYSYDGSGNKVSMKAVSCGGVLHTRTDYIEGFQYENNVLTTHPSTEGRILRKTSNLLPIQASCDVTTSFTPYASTTVTAVTQNGESYVKVVNPTTQSGAPGVYTGLTTIPAQPYKRYLYRVKGYVQNTTHRPLLFAGSNMGDIVWAQTSPALPVGAANEDWVSMEFTAPSGTTTIKVGVFWWYQTSIPSGAEFYLNDVELSAVVPEYQYGIGDHQGNTRVVFSAKTPSPVTATANFESASNPDFQNYPTGGNRNGVNLFDHTDAGTTYTYSNLLNGGNNSQIGVSRSFAVYPGDKVKIEAYAKYSNPTSTTGNLAGFAAALLSAFGAPTPISGEAGTVSAGLNDYGAAVAVGGGPSSPSGPKAFVNIILYDRSYKFLDFAYEAIDPAAEQEGASPVVAHDYMMREYTVKEAGFAFLFISNENPTQVDVYFDDVVITHTPTNVIQYNEYYPFGMRTAASWDRQDPVAGPSAQNLVAKLEFEGNALDGSGSANHGTINGGAGTSTGEGRPQVIVLDGTNDYVQINDHSSLDFGTADFSVAFWAKKLSAASGWDNLSGVSKWSGGGGTPGANEWGVGLGNGSSDNRPCIYIESGTTIYTAVSPDQMTIGQWYHITGIRQGTQLKVYVNGVLKGTATLPANTSVNNVGRNLLIGKILAGNETHAAFDELYIYGRAMSDDEVRALYLMGSGRMVNNYLYNAANELNKTSGWYETFFRGYDPVLGRFMQVDPLAGKYGSLTPYNYAFNNPALFNDPMGDDGDDPTDPMYGKRSISGPYDYWYRSISPGSGNHWSDRYASNMGAETFLSRVSSMSDGGTWSNGEAHFFTSSAEARSHISWDSYGGNEITREQWLALGGDVKKFANLYFPGAWRLVKTQQTQQDINLEKVLSIANQYAFFVEKNRLNWIIDYDGSGGTKSYKPGSTEHLSVSRMINIYIHPSVLQNSKELFLVMGHEYVHALDHDSGLFRSLVFQFGGENAYNILEYRGYTWSAAVEQALGLGMGQAGLLEFYEGLLPKDYLAR